MVSKTWDSIPKTKHRGRAGQLEDQEVDPVIVNIGLGDRLPTFVISVPSALLVCGSGISLHCSKKENGSVDQTCDEKGNLKTCKEERMPEGLVAMTT